MEDHVVDVFKGLPPYLTKEFVASTIQNVLQLSSTPAVDNIARLDENTGMCSIILSLDFKETEKDRGIIAKFPTFQKLASFNGGALPETIIRDIHNIECHAYQLLSDKEMAIPPLLGSIEVTEPGTGVLIFERFSKPTYMPDMVRGLAVGQIEVVLTSLARLHAFGLCDYGWKSDKKLKRAHTELFDGFGKWVKEGAKMWEDRWGEPLKVNLEKLSHLADPHRIKNMLKNVEYPTYCHGDLWVNNMLVFGDSGNVKDDDEFAAILDWQGLHIGSVGEDIARLLTHNVCHTVMNAHLDKFLQLYYAELQQVCNTKYKKEVPFDLQYVRREFDKNLGVGALYTLFQCTVWRQNVAKSLDSASLPDLTKFCERVEVNLAKSIENLSK